MLGLTSVSPTNASKRQKANQHPPHIPPQPPSYCHRYTQITESERLFSAFFLTKTKLLETRPLRLQVPEHPAVRSPQTNQLQHEVRRQERQPSTEASSKNGVVKARVAVTAWRNKAKLLLRVAERLDSVSTGGGGAVSVVGADAGIGAAAHNSDDGNIVGRSVSVVRVPSTKHVEEGPCGGGSVLDEGGALIVIHENEVSIYFAAPVDSTG